MFTAEQGQAAASVSSTSAIGKTVPPLIQAQRLIRKDELRKAETILRKVLANNPADSEALFWMSEIYRKQEDYQTAADWAQKAIDQAPDNMQLRLLQAGLLVDAGQLQQAESAYQSMLELTENIAEIEEINHHLLLTRGKRLSAENNWSEAQALYESALEDTPRDIALLEALGDAYSKQQAWGEAEETYHKILSIEPMHVATYLRLGRMYQEKGDHLGRWSSLQKVISLDPEGESGNAAVEDLLAQGSLYLVQQEMEAAETEISTVLEILPDNIDANLAIAQLYQQQGQFDAAELAFQRVLKQNPKDWQTRLHLAAMHFKAGHLEAAIDEYQKVLKAEPESNLGQQADTRLSVIFGVKAEQLAKSMHTEADRNQALDTAIAWIEDQRFDAALWLLGAITDQYPRYAPGHYWLGLLYEKRKQYKPASQSLGRALWLDRDNLDAQLAYGRALFQLGELINAETVLADLQKQPISPDMRREVDQLLDLTQGELLLRAGKPRAALAHYLRMQTRTPEDQELLTRLVNVHLILGNEAKADELYQRMLKTELAFLTEKELLNKGRANLNQGNLKKAEEIFKNLLRQNPDHVQAHFWLGTAYMRRKEFDLGIEHIRRSSELAPKNAKLRKSYAKSLVNAGRLASAYELYNDMLLAAIDPIEYREIKRLQGFVKVQTYTQAEETFLALNLYHDLALMYPTDITILERLAALYTQLEFWEEAANTFQLVAKLAPRRAETQIRLAHMYELQNIPIKRLEHLRRAIELDPTGRHGTLAANTLIKDGERFLKQGRIQAALTTLNSVLLAQPKHIIANLAVAEIHQKQKNIQAAETAYMKVLLQRPVDIEVRSRLAGLYTQAERYDDAITEFHRIIALAPDSGQSRDARVNLGIVYDRKTDQLIDSLATEEDKDIAVQFAKTLIEENRLRPAFRLLSQVVKDFPNDAQGQYRLASLYERRRQTNLALKHAAKSVELMPDNFKLQMAYARMLARSGNFDKAESVYKGVINNSTDLALIKESEKLLGFVTAQRLLAEKQPESALAHYKGMLEYYPNDVSILTQIANIHVKLGETKKAVTLYNEILVRNPKNPAIHMQLARIAKSRGDNDASLTHLKQVLKYDPTGPLGRQAVNALGLNDGNKHLLAKAWDKALTNYSQVLDVDPENILAHLGMADAYFNKGQLKKSEQAVDTIIELDPSQVDARLHKAKILITTKRINKAVVELERVLAMAKGTPQAKKAIINLGNIYRDRASRLSKRSKWADAIKQYKRAIERNPDDLVAHMELGRIYQRSSRHQDEALAEYQEVIRIDPTHSRAYLNLGTIYEQMQNYEKALESFTVALSHLKDSKLEKKVINLLRLQVVRQQFAEDNYAWAIEELKDMLKLEPNKASLYLFLSSIQRRDGDLEAAIESLQQAIQLSPKNVVARFRLGLLYEQVSEDQLALAQYRQITQSGRRSTIVESARNRIPILEERLKIFNFVVNYSITGSETEIPGLPTSTSFSSNLRFDLAARLKPAKNFDLSISASPSYSANHKAQTDTLIPTYGFNGRLNFEDTFFTVAASQQTTEGLLLEDFRGQTISGSLAVAQRLRIPLFLGEEETTIPQTLSLNLGVRDFTPPGVSLFTTRSYSATTSFTYPFRRGGSWGANYTFTDTQNTKPTGRDYANRGHRLGLSYSKILAPKLTTYFNAGFELKLFTFPDSRTRVEARREQKRVSGTSNFSARLIYQVHRKLSMNLSLSSSETRTNLVRGLIYSDDDRPIGFQGGSLGEYKTASASMGMQFRF